MSELARIERVVLLQSVDLFAHCRAEEILRLAAIVGERAFAAGETIFAPREAADRFYCVVRGRVELEGPDGAREVRPLESFGVVDILSGRLRTQRAAALQDTLTLACDAEDLFDLLANNIDVVKSLFRFVLTRTREGGMGAAQEVPDRATEAPPAS